MKILSLLKSDLKDYVLGTVFILLFCISTSAYLTYAVYKSCLSEYKAILIDTSHEIRKILRTSLTGVCNTLAYIGKEITRSGGKQDSEEIGNFLINMEKEKRLDGWACSWTTMVWINAEGKAIANSRYGVSKEELYATRYAKVIEASHKASGELIVCAPDWGLVSGLWIIPVGMKFANQQGEYIGALKCGIGIEELTQKFKHNTHTSSDFIIVDHDHNIISHSLDEETQNLRPLVAQLVSQFRCNEVANCELNKPITFHSVHFYHYQHLTEYPFYIFTGFDHKVMQAGFYVALFPKILEVLGFGLLSIILLYLVWYKRNKPIIRFTDLISQIPLNDSVIEIPKQNLCVEMVELEKNIEKIIAYVKETHDALSQSEQEQASLKRLHQQLGEKNEELQKIRSKLENILDTMKNSDEAIERLLDKSYTELQGFIKEIDRDSNALLSDLHNQLDLPISEEHRIQLLQEMINQVINIKAPEPEKLHLKAVDICHLLQESIVIHAKIAMSRRITLLKNLPSSLGNFPGDEFWLKQIFVGLLFQSIYHTPDAGSIEITASLQGGENGPSHIKILFTSHQFPLIEKTQIAFRADAHLPYPIALNLKAIQALIHAHGGFLEIQPREKEGATIVIILPYQTERVDAKTR